MGSYNLTEAASLDLDNLYLYGILNYGLAQADIYYDGLCKHFEMLSQYPSWGNDYGYIEPGLSRYEYHAHSIYYLCEKNKIIVIRVLGARQDPAHHF